MAFAARTTECNLLVAEPIARSARERTDHFLNTRVDQPTFRRVGENPGIRKRKIARTPFTFSKTTKTQERARLAQGSMTLTKASLGSLISALPRHLRDIDTGKRVGERALAALQRSVRVIAAARKFREAGRGREAAKSVSLRI